MYHYTNSRIHNFYLNNGFIKTRQRTFWKFSNRGTLSRLIVTSRGTLRDFRNTSARSTSLLILPPFFTVFLTTAQISLLRFLTGLYIERFRNAEDSQLSWVNRTLESISSSDARVRHLEKLQQASNEVGAFRRPRQLRASIGSVTPTFSLQNHRSEREINKGFGNCFICSRSRGSKSSSRAPPPLRDGGENLG